MATQVTLNSGSVDSAGSLLLKTNGTTTAVTLDTSQNASFAGAITATTSVTTPFVTSAAATNLLLKSAGTTAVTIDTSQNVGVGTSSPASKFNVVGGRSNFAPNSENFAVYLQFNSATSGFYIGSPSADAMVFSASSGAERVRIDSSGNLLVGTTGSLVSSASRIRATTGSGPTLDVQQTGGATIGVGAFWNTATSGDNIFNTFYTEAGGTTRGSITYNRAGGLVVYNTTSDYRAKDISGPVTNSGALIDSVPVYMGKMKWATEERPMFIAHEVPSYAHTGEKDAVDADGNPVYQQMDASALIPVMWAEIQSLRKRLAALESN